LDDWAFHPINEQGLFFLLALLMEGDAFLIHPISNPELG
jgi:hypothetical protein